MSVFEVTAFTTGSTINFSIKAASLNAARRIANKIAKAQGYKINLQWGLQYA